MCYLGEKRFEGLDLDGKHNLLAVMRDAGVIWLQMTGGEPLIDPDFPEAYRLAYELGMQIEILSNGSRLHKDHILNLLRTYPPTKLTVSMYGATADTYDSVTRNRGAFGRFSRGLRMAIDAGLNVDLSLIVVQANVHEIDDMRAWARSLDLPFREYANISPTIHGARSRCPRSLRSTSATGSRSPAARPDRRSSTPIRSDGPRSARSAASRTST
ncbi:radical SAM protein [Streptomyces sp. NPDC005195]|uniref:radical SAM protein n=1 Tax=Streptomyces sp. NPDC005195 TaxID=3154561 RepID=UPI0033BA2AB1